MKILKHLRTDWFRYGFETLAVVVGILVAFALDNWNENRTIRKTEQLLLGNLKLEIEANQERLNDAKEEGKLIQNLIVDKFIPGVNQYISLNQRIRYLGEEYSVGHSTFSPEYEGLFKDRILEGVISYIYIWRIEELKEEEELEQMMGKFISTLELESIK